MNWAREIGGCVGVWVCVHVCVCVCVCARAHARVHARLSFQPLPSFSTSEMEQYKTLDQSGFNVPRDAFNERYVGERHSHYTQVADGYEQDCNYETRYTYQQTCAMKEVGLNFVRSGLPRVETGG